MSILPTTDLEAAIEQEAKDWADFFEVPNERREEALAARRLVMRVNAKMGYFKPLKGYYKDGPCGR